MNEKKSIRRLGKKLTLNKKTIVNLNNAEMGAVRAGWALTDISHCTCDLPCPK
jgi:hypothetical protein